MKKYVLIALLTICLIGVFFLFLQQEKPGRYNWFHSLSGDWTLDLRNGYEIGPSTSTTKNVYKIIKWVPVITKEQGVKYAPRLIVDNILSYNSSNDTVLFKTMDEWGFLNTLTGEINTISDHNFPKQYEELKHNMKTPMPSLRDKLMFLLFVLIVVLLFVQTKSLCKKKSLQTLSIRKL